jgi:hypothetical protein
MSEPEWKSPTKQEAAYWAREAARLLGLQDSELSERMATRLRIVADCIEGKRRYRKPPKLSLHIVQKLDSAARYVESYHQRGHSIDEAVQYAMQQLDIHPASAEEAEAVRGHILATRSKLKK